MIHTAATIGLASWLLIAASGGGSAIQLDIAPLNGIDVLLRDETVLAFIVYKNTSTDSLSAPLTEGRHFEIRRPGGLWEQCVKPNPKLRPLQPGTFRYVFVPGEELRWYVGPIDDHLCPGVSSSLGSFELRVVEDWDSDTRVTSSAHSFRVEEPGGLDAEALTFKREHRNDVHFLNTFVSRFAASPYAADFGGVRGPGDRSLPLAALVVEAKQRQLNLASTAYLESVRRFLAQNPDHLKSAEFRREVLAAAVARGDKILAGQMLDQMARRPREQDAAAEARALLDETTGGPGNR